MSDRSLALSHEDENAIAALLDFSRQVGSNPCLVQANNGNTSVKLGRTLWIKASGKWLADAGSQDILVPVHLDDAARCLKNNSAIITASECSESLRPSIETAMHAVLPYRVVAHVHSVNTIAWALRSDAPFRLAELLSNLPWAWVPYVESGVPLARAVSHALSRSPGAEIFVLGNHGLVVCGDSSAVVAHNLEQVERRLHAEPRPTPHVNRELLDELTRSTEWVLPDSDLLHALATDPISLRVLLGGVLFPCQVVFLGQALPVISARETEHGEALDSLRRFARNGSPFVLIEDAGMLLRREITPLQRATLQGLADVIQRTCPVAPIRYLASAEVFELIRKDFYGQNLVISEPATVSS